MPPRLDGFHAELPNLLCPVSLIIDDGTPLPEDRQDGGRWAILDAFADLCSEHGVHGKFSVLSYLDGHGMIDAIADPRVQRNLAEYVRTLSTRLMPRFDITPEIISHGMVINPATGRPLARRFSAAELTRMAVVDLHRRWRFRLGKSWPGETGRRSREPEGADAGIAGHWQAPGLDDIGWGEQALPGVWTGGHGIGWFRTTFDLPATATGKRLFLAVMGIEHACAIWLNGREVGTWKSRRLDGIEVTAALVGGSNQLTLRILDVDGRGGVTGCIQLVEEEIRPELFNEARWSQSQDEDTLERYIGRALRALRNVGLAANGVTSPWDFGLQVEGAYARAVGRALERVNGIGCAWYFLATPTDDVIEPRLMCFDRERRTAVVSVPASGRMVDMTISDEVGPNPAAQADAYLTADGKGGALARLLSNRSHAILCGHWQCLKAGIPVYREVFTRLAATHAGVYQWMSCSAIARQHAVARTFRPIKREDGACVIESAFACPDFTLAFTSDVQLRRICVDGRELRHGEAVDGRLDSGAWRQAGSSVHVCFDLVPGAVLAATT